MSAVAGIVYPELFPVTYAIEPALESLKERANQSPSIYTHKNIELGARGTPIAVSNKKNIISLVDGELEEIPQLRTELRRAGFVIQTESIPQLIIHAYEAWGIHFAERLHGAFALALFDLRDHLLILARDRLGICPLYWSLYNRYFLFASELKALLATGLVPQVPASDGIAAYLSLGFIPQDLTAIQHINKLLPGHILRVGPQHPLLVKPYWSYSSCFSPPLEKWNVPQELSACIQPTIQHALQDGTTAYYASGSIGSAYLADQVAASPTGSQATGIAIHFPHENEDEVGIAQEVAKRLNLKQTTVTVTPESMLEDLAHVVWRLDDPIASPMACALWSFYEQVPRCASKMLSPVGMSAILSAHRPVIVPSAATRFRHQTMAKWLLRLFRQSHSAWIYRRILEDTRDPWIATYLAQQALFDQPTLQKLSPISRSYHPQIYLQRFYQLAYLGAGPDSQMYLDVKTSLCDREILPHDRLATMHNVHWSSPYIGEQLVTYMAQLPDEAKTPLVEYEHPLHQLLRPELTDLTYCRPAWGSPTFLNAWMYDAGLQRVWPLLLEGSLVESGWVSRRWLSQVLNRSRGSRRITFQQLWGLLVLEVWFQQFINRPVKTERPALTTTQLLRQ